MPQISSLLFGISAIYSNGFVFPIITQRKWGEFHCSLYPGLHFQATFSLLDQKSGLCFDFFLCCFIRNKFSSMVGLLLLRDLCLFFRFFNAFKEGWCISGLPPFVGRTKSCCALVFLLLLSVCMLPLLPKYFFVWSLFWSIFLSFLPFSWSAGDFFLKDLWSFSFLFSCSFDIFLFLLRLCSFWSSSLYGFFRTSRRPDSWSSINQNNG